MSALLRRAWSGRLLVSAVFLVAPLGVALFLAAEPKVIFFLFANVQGMEYAANGVFLLLMASGQLAVFVNLTVTLLDVFLGVSADGELPRVRSSLRVVNVLLAVFWLAQFVYFIVGGACLSGVAPTLAACRFDALAEAGRWAAVITFALFLCLDLWLYRVFKGKAEAVAPDGREAAEASRRLYGLSLVLVDLPSLAVTLTSWWTIHRISESEIAVMRFLGADFASGPLLVRDGSTVPARMFLNGFDAGAIAAAMLISQVTYVFLTWRHGQLDAESNVELGTSPAAGSG